MIILVSHLSGHRRSWCLAGKVLTGQDVYEELVQREGKATDVVLQSGGHVLSAFSPVPADASVVATLRLPGGKGGFGSMLRAIGAQIEKTTNREACRDLSGRRLRDINEEKRLKDFISKKVERERDLLEKKRQKFQKLSETPKHVFQDESYYQQRELREKNLFDSLDKAFASGSSGGPSQVKKRSSEGRTCPAPKKKGRFMDDLDDSSDEDSASDDDASEGKESAEDKRSSEEEESSEEKESSGCEDVPLERNDKLDRSTEDNFPPATSQKSVSV